MAVTGSSQNRDTQAELVVIKIVGQLSAAGFAKQLRDESDLMRANGNYGLCIDILEMSGYEPAVRETYMQWARANSSRIRRVAVVTDKTMWRLVVATIGMATGGNTRAFEHAAEAKRWCQTG